MKVCNEIQKRLMRQMQISRNEIILPNFFMGRWEMDVMKITSADYVIEYEIKISRSDFFADFKKAYGYKEKRLKHDVVKAGEHHANRFFFVVPEGLVKVEEVPKHCGLIEYDGNYLNVVKAAPLLHKRPFKDYKSICSTLAGREYFLRLSIRQMQDQHDNKIQKLKAA